jgi:acyl-CoA thioester hydrolase
MQVVLPIHVIAFETDFGGVVSNTRYVEYLERGRAALMRAANLTTAGALELCGAQPVVRHVEVEYLAPAFHEDELELRITVAAHEGARSLLRFELVRPHDGTILMRALQTLAYLTPQWKPVRVPSLFKEKMPVVDMSHQNIKAQRK